MSTPRSRIDPRRLLEFLSVIRHGSFSAAAAADDVSQPALSQAIALLERQLGERVMERGRQGARPNRLGEALVFHAEALEALLERAKIEMELRAKGLIGTLAIGITPVTSVGLVPKAMARLLAETPDVSVSIVEGLDREITEMLRQRRLDLVISRVGVGPELPDLAEKRLFNADWSLIVGPGHSLAGRRSVRLADLGDLQWVLPAGGSAFREQMERVFAGVGLHWPIRGTATNSISAIKAIVMNTNSVSIMASSLVEIEVAAGLLHTVALDDVGPQHPVGILWRRDEPFNPIAAHFAAITEDLCRDL
jgi:DNA-binding transcriptional LysR family regulator